jgi:hypothetical protein
MIRFAALRLQQGVEAIELFGPERLVEAQPLVGRSQWRWFNPAQVHSALHPAAHKACAFEHLDML